MKKYGNQRSNIKDDGRVVTKSVRSVRRGRQCISRQGASHSRFPVCQLQCKNKQSVMSTFDQPTSKGNRPDASFWNRNKSLIVLLSLSTTSPSATCSSARSPASNVQRCIYSYGSAEFAFSAQPRLQPHFSPAASSPYPFIMP
jgi:hypothetical protein